MLKPSPWGPLVRSMVTLRPIRLVLVAKRVAAELRISVPEDPGPPLLLPFDGNFLVEETVATLGCPPTTATK